MALLPSQRKWSPLRSSRHWRKPSKMPCGSCESAKTVLQEQKLPGPSLCQWCPKEALELPAVNIDQKDWSRGPGQTTTVLGRVLPTPTSLPKGVSYVPAQPQHHCQPGASFPLSERLCGCRRWPSHGEQEHRRLGKPLFLSVMSHTTAELRVLTGTCRFYDNHFLHF